MLGGCPNSCPGFLTFRVDVSLILEWQELKGEVRTLLDARLDSGQQRSEVNQIPYEDLKLERQLDQQGNFGTVYHAR